jgi:hypothetical protein
MAEKVPGVVDGLQADGDVRAVQPRAHDEGRVRPIETAGHAADLAKGVPMPHEVAWTVEREIRVTNEQAGVIDRFVADLAEDPAISDELERRVGAIQGIRNGCQFTKEGAVAHHAAGKVDRLD